MLRVERLTAGYEGPPIVRDLALELHSREVLGILGRNGSGKSTLIKSIVGLLPRIDGSIDFLGVKIVGLPCWRIARLGVAYVPQGRGIFPRLTVLENLQAGTRAAPRGESFIPEEIFSYFPILAKRLKQYGGTMSGGEQQMLAIARALCSRPKLLLMDEPSDGVQPNIVEMLGELIPQIAHRSELAVILVEQNLDLALAVCRRCMILDKGAIVHEGAPQDFVDPAILKRYLAV
jgi:ABC-type branched-subunit amino acid transport system ATPase component